jgi:hypothetical protein
MTYDEVEVGQTVRIMTPTPKHRQNGVVIDKQIVNIGGGEVERVYINTENGGRRVCAPSVLSLLDTKEQHNA